MGGRRDRAVEAQVRGEVQEDDALVERPAQAPFEAAGTALPAESPLTSVVVEGPVGRRVRYVMLRSPSGDVAMDELGDVGRGLGWRHAPELIEKVLATQQCCQLLEPGVPLVSSQVPNQVVLGNLIRPLMSLLIKPFMYALNTHG